MNPLKWILKKLGADNKPVETSGEIPATDERMNSLVEKYRAKKKADAAAVPAGAFVEIDGEQVAMSDLMALEVANTKETPEAIAAREKQEAADAAAETERQNSRKQGYADFMEVANARQKAAQPADFPKTITAPDTLAQRCARGKSAFGRAPVSADLARYSGKN